MKSLATDVESFANDEAKRQREKKPAIDFQFRGVMYQRVDAIRSFDGGTYDVVLLVRRGDPAHAGVVRYTTFETQSGVVSHSVVRALCEFFRFAPAGSAELRKLLET
jgi:hypothetical protein